MGRLRVFKRVSGKQTRNLTEPTCSLTMRRPRPFWKMLAFVTFFGLFATGVGYYFSDKDEGACRREGVLTQENQKLVQALKQSELQAKHETATRESLEKLLSEQSEEIKRLSGELAFFQKNRKTLPGRQ